MINFTVTVVAVSLLLSCSVIANAFYLKKQFYPSVVYIYKSNLSMAIMYLQVLVAVHLLGKLICKIFFGSVNIINPEHFFKKVLLAVIDTILTFIIFKDDLSTKLVTQYTLLLFLKCLHWLAKDRVDYIEQSPTIQLFHVRLCFLLSLLTLGDVYFVHKVYTTPLANDSLVHLTFRLEYRLLLILAANAAFKYVLHAVDVYSDTFWESKAIVSLCSKFFIGLCKIALYMDFLIIMLWTYTLPLFVFLPMYHNIRIFKTVVRDLRSYHRVIHNMNIHFPDATVQDLQVIDNMCLICRGDMIAAAAKKLRCNHIFHSSCLRSWFLRHPRCPTCRLFMPVHQ